jgi:hypothetical protein
LNEQRIPYSGGIANVLVLGDHAKAMAAIDALESELVWVDSDEPRFSAEQMGPLRRRNPRIMRRFQAGAHGLYRAGDELPDDVIGVSAT